MATKFQETEDQIEEIDDIEAGEAEADNPAEDDDDQDDDDGFDIGFEGEPATEVEDDTPLVKKLRQEIRERDRRLAEATKAAQKVEVGPEPDLWEDCEGDPAKYKAALLKWNADKAAAEQQEAEASKATAAQDQEHTAALDHYRARKIAMARPDFDDAEAAVVDALDNQRQALIVHAAQDSAKVIYALGRSPAKLAELSAITNPIKFVAAIAKLEEKITMTPRRKAPAVDNPVRGSASVAQHDSDQELERLEKEAARTNDRSKVIAYKREKRLTAK